MIAAKEKGQFNFGESLKGFSWKHTQADERAVLTLTQKLDLPEILATILVKRGQMDAEAASDFLNPKLKNALVDPFKFKDMDKAAERISEALINNEKITIFGDYDVDGATSSSLLKLFFQDLGVESEIYIPNRISEGYGPNCEAMKKIAKTETKLVICVDCGTVSFEPLKTAKELGLEVIVLDHHLSGEEMPEAVAVVNPNRMDDEFPFKSLAAVGVAFLTAIAIRKVLRAKKYFTKEVKEPDLLRYLDLVALGTVCDVMQLVGINRAFVTQGLKLIAKGNNLGIKALAKVSKVDSKPQSYHLGFILGPRINAGGRIGEGILGARLLSEQDPIKAMELAEYLEKLNSERRTIEALVLEEVIEQVESEELYKNPLIVVKGKDWHQGILGILASRLKEKYNRPSAVISIANGVGKGSARSITGVDLGSLLANAKQEGILLEGGGHAMAGGFSVEAAKIDKFIEYTQKTLQSQLKHYAKAKEIEIDAVLSLTAINGELVKTLARAAPFGNGNKQPKLVVANVTIVKLVPVGKGHLMVIVADKFADPDMKNTLKCMFFKCDETEAGARIRNLLGHEVNLLGYPQTNINDPSRADFIIDDVCTVS